MHISPSDPCVCLVWWPPPTALHYGSLSFLLVMLGDEIFISTLFPAINMRQATKIMDSSTAIAIDILIFSRVNLTRVMKPKQ